MRKLFKIRSNREYSSSESNTNFYVLFITLAFCIGIGGFLRFYRLGALPIDGDNSFHALSAQAIIDTGKPIMDSGSFYIRALPLLYAEALSYRLFGVSEWSLRLPNAIFGTINIILVFVLCRMISKTKGIALLSAFLFAISPWAIAVSRMPRMYETLTFAVLLFLIFFYSWYYRDKRFWVWPMILISILAVSLHEVAIVPLTCLVVPLLLDRNAKKKAVISAGVFAAIALFWLQYNNLVMHLLSS